MIRRKCTRLIVHAVAHDGRYSEKFEQTRHCTALHVSRWWWLVVWGRDVMVTRGGSYTHEAAGHAAMVSTEIKSKEEEIIFSVYSCP